MVLRVFLRLNHHMKYFMNFFFNLYYFYLSSEVWQPEIVAVLLVIDLREIIELIAITVGCVTRLHCDVFCNKTKKKIDKRVFQGHQHG